MKTLDRLNKIANNLEETNKFILDDVDTRIRDLEQYSASAELDRKIKKSFAEDSA